MNRTWLGTSAQGDQCCSGIEGYGHDCPGGARKIEMTWHEKMMCPVGSMTQDVLENTPSSVIICGIEQLSQSGFVAYARYGSVC
mmetsp:Transcript_78541/g.173324  ORF Transcript_78541/g.173324 Transcript_78541/m.173324 type:complete len:84 (+) Transcript_78541:841-1092(+)